MLEAAGWDVQDLQQMNLWAGRGAALREYLLQTGEADYLLFADCKAVRRHAAACLKIQLGYRLLLRGSESTM
jgi:hypothetical protein